MAYAEPTLNYFQRLRNIEAEAAKAKRALTLYVPGGMGHRIITGRIERLPADWRMVNEDRKAAMTDAMENQISPNGVRRSSRRLSISAHSASAEALGRIA